MLACVLGALSPDIDIIPTLWGRVYYMTEHRGFTHSLLGLIPVSLLTAWVAFLFVRGNSDRASFKALFGMAMLGVISHDFLDWCTSWGTMLLWPDRTRFALDHLFIVDLWYILVLGLPVLLSFVFSKRRVLICALGIGAAAIYHLAAAYNHHAALMIVKEDRPTSWRAAFPQVLSPFRWSAFNRQDGVLRGAHIDFLRYPAVLGWQTWQEPPLTPELKAAMDSLNGKTFMWFARVPMWSEEREADGSFAISCWDLRFYSYYMGDQIKKRFQQQFVVKNGKVEGGGF